MEKLKQLYAKWMAKGETPEEAAVFAQLLDDPAAEDQLLSAMDQAWLSEPDAAAFDHQKRVTMAQRIVERYPAVDIPYQRPVHLLRTAWFRYAAAILLIVGTGAYFWNQQQPVKTKQTTSLQTEISPGSNRAVLTAGGKAITLSSDKTGISVGSIITYNDGERITDAGQMLVLTTPPGGQYQAVLPDGTKVWLNAASGIKFPSRFDGPERKVEITGEVYLEIAKNAKQPFIVQANATTVEVLGTSFNMNAYSDEPAVTTTLLEGRVKVLRNNNSAILQPGEQAEVNSNGVVQVNSHIETGQILAWKNGLFNFDGLTIIQIARQLERWYDIQVKFEGKTDINEKFKGELQRSLSLSQVIKLLESLNVKCRLEERKLIID